MFARTVAHDGRRDQVAGDPSNSRLFVAKTGWSGGRPASGGAGAGPRSRGEVVVVLHPIRALRSAGHGRRSEAWAAGLRSSGRVRSADMRARTWRRAVRT